DKLTGLGAERVSQQAVVETLSDGQQPQQLLCLVVKALDTHHQGLAQRAWHRAAAVGAARQQFLDIERVALAAHEQSVDEVAFARKRAHRADDRGVWQLGLGQLEALTRHRDGSGALRLVAQRSDQARLPDAGVAADQEQRRRARSSRLEGVLELDQLEVAPY